MKAAVETNRRHRRQKTNLVVRTRAYSFVPGYNICAIWQHSRETQKLFKASKRKRLQEVDRLEDFIAVLDNSNSTAFSFEALAENMLSEHKKEVHE
jgi:hypothetical protein